MTAFAAMNTDPRATGLRTPGQRPEAATAGVRDANPILPEKLAIHTEIRP